MRTGYAERERTFDGAEAVAFPALEGIPDVAQITDADPEELDAVYYDTPDLRLLEHGVTLRRRTGGHDAGWHLKLPVGPDERDEIRLPLSAGARGRVPRELVLRTRAFARGAALAPVVHLHTRRRRRLLLDAGERSLAEIAEDTVSAQVLGGPEQQTGAVATLLDGWTEVEAELVEGGTELLDAVERQFSRAGLRRSESPSKLARALGRTSGHGDAASDRGRLRPGSLGAAVATLLREQSAALLALDPRVRADEPDAVHRMRVAARRLRSTLRTHRRLFSDPQAEQLAEELRWLGRLLGEARDQEVLRERLAAWTGRLSAEECPGPVRERVLAWYTERYRRSWKRATAALDSPRYYALLDLLEALATRPPMRGRARRDAVAGFGRTARRERRRVRRRLAEADAAPAGPSRDAALHGARKAAKRARYAAEGAAPTVGRPAKRFAKRMKALQKLLGERQDALVAAAALPELAEAAHRAGEPGFGYGLLYAGQRAAVAEADRALPAVRRKAERRRTAGFG